MFLIECSKTRNVLFQNGSHLDVKNGTHLNNVEKMALLFPNPVINFSEQNHFATKERSKSFGGKEEEWLFHGTLGSYQTSLCSFSLSQLDFCKLLCGTAEI